MSRRTYVALLLAQLLLATGIGITSFLPVTDIGRLLPRGEKTKADNLLFFGDLAKYSPSHLLSEIAKRSGQEADIRPRCCPAL